MSVAEQMAKVKAALDAAPVPADDRKVWDAEHQRFLKVKYGIVTVMAPEDEDDE